MTSQKLNIQSSQSGEISQFGEKLTQSKEEIKSRIKIVRIIARLNVGGPARHVVWTTLGTQGGEEFDSVLLAGTIPEGEEDMGYFAEQNNVSPIFIREMSRELSLKDVVVLWKIFRLLKNEKPDIIHTHTAKAGTVGRIAGFVYRWLTWRTLIAAPRRVKMVHTFHGHVFHSYYGNAKTRIFLFIEKMLARFATDIIVVISRQQFAEIHEQFGIGQREQFRIISVGIDLEEFADWRAKQNILREEIGADADEILIGLVGRLTEIKNHSLFLKVAQKHLEKPDSPKLKFVVVGDGHLRGKLESEAESLGVKDSVIFLGNRTDADVFYAGLDIIALTSLNEGTPFSILEAMANEKPVISTNVGGVIDLLGAEVEEQREGFQIHERGISCVSGDAEGFYNGLRYLSNNAKIREIIGKRGKEFVKTEYRKERLVENKKNLYRKLFDS